MLNYSISFLFKLESVLLIHFFGFDSRSSSDCQIGNYLGQYTSA